MMIGRQINRIVENYKVHILIIVKSKDKNQTYIIDRYINKQIDR